MARKFLSLLLALVMVFAVSSALAENPGDIYEVEMFNVYANYMGIQPGWYGKILEDKLGIRLNIIAPNVAGNGDALYQSRTAAGNLGDILILDRNKMIDCYKAGLLLDITPYLADCPNLQKLSVAYNRFAEIIGSGDQIYVLPGKVATAPTDKPAARGVNPDKGTFVRWDYWSELGAPHVKNIDELFENLYKMQDAHPENENGEKNYAFSLFPDWDSYSLRCASEFYYSLGYGPASNWIWCSYDGKDIVNLTDDDGMYYQILKKFNEAYRNGYLDPDSSTQDWDTLAAKARDGRFMYSHWTYLGDNIFSGTFDTETQIPYATVPLEDCILLNKGYNNYGDGQVFAIGSQAKDPAHLMQFLDFYASEEGVLLNNELIEGVTYEMVDGHPVLTEFGKDKSDSKMAPESMGGGNWREGVCQINFPMVHADDAISLLGGESATTAIWESTLAEGSNKYTDEWEQVYGSKYPINWYADNGKLTVAVGTDYTAPAESSDIQTNRAQLNELFKTASWQMVYAESDEEFEEIWTTMKAQLPDFGYDEVIAYDMEVAQGLIDSRKPFLP